MIHLLGFDCLGKNEQISETEIEPPARIGLAHAVYDTAVLPLNQGGLGVK
jgi:hypothetical protein